MEERSRVFLVILVVVAVIFGSVLGIGIWMTRGMNEMLDLAIGEIDLNKLRDGVYSGSFEGYRWSNTVEVTVESHKIKDIQIVKKHSFQRDELVNELSERIIQQQSLKVDVVTEATVSSKAFLKAVEDALSGE